MEKVKIAPSILSANFADIKNAVKSIESADMIHCDVMDGIFVPNISFGSKMVADIGKTTNLPLDVHLMILRPIKYIPQFLQAGASIISFHLESEVDVSAGLSLIKSGGAKCGLAISPDTPVEAVLPYIAECDMLLLMSVYPGFSGQKFIQSSIERLKQLNELRNRLNPSMLIEIDGGVGQGNIGLLHQLGVDIAVAGNAVFNSDPIGSIALLRNA